MHLLRRMTRKSMPNRNFLIAADSIPATGAGPVASLSTIGVDIERLSELRVWFHRMTLIGPASALQDCFASSSMYNFEMFVWCASRCSSRLERAAASCCCPQTSLHKCALSSLIHCNVNKIIECLLFSSILGDFSREKRETRKEKHWIALFQVNEVTRGEWNACLGSNLSCSDESFAADCSGKLENSFRNDKQAMSLDVERIEIKKILLAHKDK